MIEKITPSFFIESLLDLKSSDLKAYQLLIVDVDNTLLVKKQSLTDDYKVWLAECMAKHKTIVLVSNNRSKQIQAMCDEWGIEYYPYSFKPTSKVYKHILARHPIDPKQILCIGDQLFTDILGANRMGLDSVYVKPLSKQDVVFTKFTRGIEKLFLKQMKGYKYD